MAETKESIETKSKIKFKDIMTMDINDLIKKKDSSSNKSKKRKKVEKKSEVVAFDIGTDTIKIVVGKYLRGKLTIKKCIDIPTPSEAINDGEIVNSEILVEVLSDALQINNIKAKDAVCITNSSAIINREILIPKVEEDEIDTVIKFEIRQYLPINLDHYIVQFTILDEVKSEKNEKLKVNVITYPKKIAKQYYELLKELDLRPYALDVTYNSLNKLVKLIDKANESENNAVGTSAYIDFGATAINVNIYKNGNLEFTRIIKLGGYDIDYALSRSMGISTKTIEQVKIEKCDITDLEDENNQAAKSVADEMITEIERLFQFYKNRNVGNTIDKVYLYGGASNLKGLSAILEDRLNVGIEKISKIENVNLPSKEEDKESIETYINAIGSIIRLEYEIEDVNFFAPYRTESKAKKDKKIYVYGTSILLGGAILGTFSVNTFNEIKLGREISHYESILNAPELQEEIRLSDEVNKKLDILGRYESGLTEITDALVTRDVVTVDILDKISSVLPQDVSFKSISINGTTITLPSTSKSRTAIAEVLHNLKQIDFIQDVKISTISGDGESENGYSFTLTCVLKGVS